MKNEEMKSKKENKVEAQDVLAEYMAQTKEDENVHFEHVDWVYSDSSDCCC